MNAKQDSFAKKSALIIISISLFMVSLDMSIVNLAISKMMITFNATYDQIQWVLSAYTLALGVTMPTSAYLSEKFGTKKIFIVSLALFTAGSFLCGISWNILSIIVFRIIQGLGGGLILPVSMAMLFTTFEEKERGMVIAIIGITSLAAPALGPTLGGYIIENIDWRFVFLINIPVGILGIILAFILLQEHEHHTEKHFDLVGLITSSIGMGCVLYVLGKSDLDWHDFNNIMLMTIGSFSLIIFIINELTIKDPMLDLKLLKNYTFAMSNIILNIAILALFGGIFLIPIFLQQLKDLTPFQAGLILFPEAIATAVSMIIASKLSKKIGARACAVFALALIAFNGYLMSKISFDTSNLEITILLMVRGLGVGVLMVPVQLAGFDSVPKESMSNATALNSTIKQIGTSIGVTVITSVMQHRSTANYTNLYSQVNVFNQKSTDLLGMLKGMLIQGGIPQNDAGAGALGILYGAVSKQAALQAINDTMFVISIISIVVILPVLLFKESKNLGENGPVMFE